MIRKAYIDVADGQLHYRATTEGSGPPLVFFHMTASSSEAYEGLMRELDGRFPMIAFDTVNYGESYRTTREPDIGYIADTKLEALRNLGIDKFHTFGHHTGTSIQIDMALKAPDRVLSSILNGVIYGKPEEMGAFMQTMAIPNPKSIKGSQFIWAWSRTKDNLTMLPWEQIPHAVDILHRDTVDTLRAGENWHWGYQAVFSYDTQAALQQVKSPVFLVCGAKDLAYQLHQSAAHDCPHFAEHVNDEAGVFYAETHPEVLAPEIAEFIEKVNGN